MNKCSRKRSGIVVGAASLALALLLFAGQATAVRADVVVTSGGDKTVLEGKTVQFTFFVKNNDNFDRILDFALATINHPGPVDPADFVNFSGANGANGLVSAQGIIPAGATVPFIYSVTAPVEPGATDVDFGVNIASFFIETTRANPNRVPNLIPLPAAANMLFLDQSLAGQMPNPAVLANLVNNFTPPPIGGPFLYSDPVTGLPLDPSTGFGIPYPTTLKITAFDVPEPSPLALASAAAALVGAVSFYRSRRTCAV